MFSKLKTATAPAAADRAVMIARHAALTADLEQLAARATDERERLQAAVDQARAAMRTAEDALHAAAARQREAQHYLTIQRDQVAATLRRTCPAGIATFETELERLFFEVGDLRRIEPREPFVIDPMRSVRVGTPYSNAAGVSRAVQAIVALRTRVLDQWPLELVDDDAVQVAVLAARTALPLNATHEFLQVA